MYEMYFNSDSNEEANEVDEDEEKETVSPCDVNN